MRSRYQNVPDAVLKVGLQHYHPLGRSKHLSCQSLQQLVIIQEKSSNETYKQGAITNVVTGAKSNYRTTLLF